MSDRHIAGMVYTGGMTWRTGIIPLVLAAGLLLPTAARSAENTLSRYQASYAKHMATFKKDAEEQLEALPEKYVAALDQLERDMQKAGDLDGILLVRKERERYRKAKDVPDEPNAILPESLQKLQSQYAAAVKGIETEKAKSIHKLAGQYLSALEDLKRKLTTEGEVEQAMAVNFEIATVRASKEVVWASETIAPQAGEAEAEPDAEMPEAPVESELGSILRDQSINYLQYSLAPYDFDDAIEGLLDQLYPRGVKIQLVPSGRIEVRSVSYAQGGKPHFYAECAMPELPAWTRYYSVELKEVSALSALEYLCADYGLGYRFDGKTVAIADRPEDASYTQARLISAADFGKLFEDGAISAIREYKGKTYRIWGDISGVGKALGGKTYVEVDSVRPLRIEFGDEDSDVEKMVGEFHKTGKSGGSTYYYSGSYYYSSSSGGSRKQYVGLIVTATCDSLAGTKVVLKNPKCLHWRRYVR